MVVPEHSVHYLEIVTPDVETMCDLHKMSWLKFPAHGSRIGECVCG